MPSSSDNGAIIALGGVALLAGAAVASSRAGSGYRMPAGPGDAPSHPTFAELQELLDLSYSVDDITDVFPDSVRWPDGNVAGVLIETRDRGPVLIVDGHGGAVLGHPAPGRSGSASAAGTALAGLVTYLAYGFVKSLARKKSQRFLAADMDTKIEMLRESSGLNRKWWDFRGKLSRPFIRAFLADRDRAETLAETIDDFLRKHGKDAEKVADMALAANMKNGAVIMAAAKQIEAEGQRNAAGSRSWR